MGLSSKVIIVSLLSCISLAYSTTVTIKATRYKLRIYNGTQDAGAKYDTNITTASGAGMYARYANYSSEVLCAFNMSPIPAGVTINSVSFGYTVASKTAATQPVKIFKVSTNWTGIPQYNTFGTTAWPQADSLAFENCSGTGLRTLTTTKIKTAVEDWIATPSSSHGMVISNNPMYFADSISVTGAQIVVDYSLNTVPLTIQTTIGGTTNPAPGTIQVQSATDVSIAATPATRYHFVNWSIVSGTPVIADHNSPTTTVRLTEAATICANFDVDNDGRWQDSMALVALYNSTAGASWANKTNWLTVDTIETWYGVTVASGKITGINLNGNNLNGIIPPAIGNLCNLKTLVLSNNHLNGCLPKQLGQLSQIENLNLSNNQLSATIPLFIWHLYNLQIVNLSVNNFSGKIPGDIVKGANKIGELRLNGNNFSGEIPAEFCNFDELSILMLGDNNLSGRVPGTLSSLTHLTQLDLKNNHLSGFAQELAILTPSFLDVSNNNICMPNTVIANWLNTYDSDWSTNQTCSRTTDSLTLVDIYRATDGASWANKANWLQDGFPIDQWYGVTLSGGRVIELQLNNNNLKGEFPTTIGDLSELRILNLHENELTGPIPTILGELINLTELNLGNNRLTRFTPSSFSYLVNLTDLNLSGNLLSGIETSLWTLSNLTSLNLNENLLTGELSALIGNLVNLQYLNLSLNLLTGSLPSSIGNINNLQEINLNNNKLTNLPVEITSLNPVSADFGGNKLCDINPTIIPWLNTHDPDWASTGRCGSVGQVEPNYVEFKAYSSMFSGTPLTARIYFDGTGKDVETQRLLNRVSNRMEISATLYDLENKPVKVYKPYIKETGSFGYIPTENVETEANNYYITPAEGSGEYKPDAGGKAYQAIEYLTNDVSGRIKSKNIAGANFTGHEAKIWYLQTKLNSTSHTKLNADGFVKPEYLTPDDLDYFAQSSDANLFLTVVRDPNGKYTQRIADIFGRTIRTSDQNGNLLTENVYDILNHLVIQKPPIAAVNPIENTTCSYNSLGQPTENYTPDAGLVKYKYNRAGLLIFSQDAKQRYYWGQGTGKPMLMIAYDHLGRQFSTGIYDNSALVAATFDALDERALNPVALVSTSSYKEKIRIIYDDINDVLPFLTNSTLSGLDPSAIKNSIGQTVAQIYYGENYHPTNAPRDKIIEVFSFDDEGRINKSYKSIPDLPLQTVEYFYEKTGEFKKKVYFTGVANIVTEFFYNSDGDLVSAERNGKKVADYSYYEYGPLSSKAFTGRPGGSTVNFEIKYRNTINDWLAKIDYQKNSTKYIENIYYEKLPGAYTGVFTNQEKYDGNVSYLTIDQSTVKQSELRLNYQYDNFNRLIAVRNGNVDTKNDESDADYAYDITGRFTKKVDGYESDGTPIKNWTEYKYEDANSRLTHIAGGGKKDLTSGNKHNYVYDPNGNMVLDRSKKMMILYDWRNLPVQFRFYNNIPPDQDIAWYNTLSFSASGAKMVSYVKMEYDCSGRRVAKIEYKK